MEKTMDKIVAVAKSRGFVYPGSEIYGGLANTWAKDLEKLGSSIGVVIRCQHEDIFNMMHRI